MADIFGRFAIFLCGFPAAFVLCAGSPPHPPAPKQHYMMLRRNLLYTGVPRGKRLVILVGDKRAVAITVKGTTGRRRGSKLQEWLAPDIALVGDRQGVAREDGVADETN